MGTSYIAPVKRESKKISSFIKEKAVGSPIKRHLPREKSIPTVRGVSSSRSVVRIVVGETNQWSHQSHPDLGLP